MNLNKVVFREEDRFLYVWRLILSLVSLYYAFRLPLVLVRKSSYPAFFIVDIMAAFVFLVDIFVQSRTAIKREGKFITDIKSLSKDYFSSSRFFIDLIAALPLDVFLIWTTHLSFFAPLALLRLLKLLRLKDNLEYMATVKFNPALFRLLLMVLWIILAAHSIACGWLAISGIDSSDSFSYQYLRAIYWTITTLTTIGYGDITPSSPALIMYTILIELIGAAMYGLIIGSIANLISKMDTAKIMHREKVEKINAFLSYKHISPELQKKIRDYFDYLWDTRRGHAEESVLTEIPHSLKLAVALEIHKDVIQKVPLFKDANDDFIRDIILHLQSYIVSPGDYIIRAGEIGLDMFFINRGSVEVVSADESVRYAVLSEGQFFGEMALVLQAPRTATVRSLEYCDLYRLDKGTFDNILIRYPDVASQIEMLAQQRKAEIDKKK
ncbi:cyclic nucleotide-binding domain-containing protein [Spirochaetia bacterium 38H-sp]|uniref:Cyclic nucleotide-binding domain-containing protein n=1 Tax=Rarispira pelagica TaxID=3141764 RepID=A0ABU9UBW8_9SPIR